MYKNLHEHKKANNSLFYHTLQQTMFYIDSSSHRDTHRNNLDWMHLQSHRRLATTHR